MAGIAQFFIEGGKWMIPIAFISFLVAAVAVERVIFLFFRYNINGSAFMAQIQKLVMANNIDRAIKLCNAAPNAALPRIVKAGLTRANRTEGSTFGMRFRTRAGRLTRRPATSAWAVPVAPSRGRRERSVSSTTPTCESSAIT